MAIVYDQHGDRPSARFGHTTTRISRTTVVLFGGATGGKYILFFQ